ncbi:MAG: D-ala-D-ala dipeptidase family protein [Candidatus Saccharibacteria bacterium]|nr:D-ala-D-ala dipeptidase family protein [Candidatus Saccharibacteria bacterium]
MNKQDVYIKLSEKMVLYADLVGVPVKDSQEPLVKIATSEALSSREIDPDTLTVFDKDIYVRKTVADLLQRASSELRNYSKDMSLEVVYGHRPLAIQKSLFDKYFALYSKKYQGIELYEAVHRSIAVPEIAGHPAGAAVDIRILKSGKPINMGTGIWEFVPDSYTFSPFISRQAWANRRLLRDTMKQVGFAPYDGEWWHFSYGDKEWAKYYNKPNALYEQLEQ